MEEIFHFQAEGQLGIGAKHYTIQPCFSDIESNFRSGEDLNKETSSTSPFLVKKSHFSKGTTIEFL